MAFTAIQPSGRLAAHVAMIWDCAMETRPFGLERILPKAGASLIINLAEDETRSYRHEGAWHCQRRSGSVLVGPGTRHFIIDTAEQCDVAGVEFHPGGARAFFRDPLDRLRDADTDLGDLASTTTDRLREQMLEAGSAQRRISLLQDWLLERFNEAALPDLVTHALNGLQRVPRMQSVSALAGYTGVSVRRLGSLFRENVGVSPKRFLRLQRFADVIASTHARGDINWSAVAADCGFHDQSHLVHEFREFSGIAPGAWLSTVGPYPRHVPIETVLSSP